MHSQWTLMAQDAIATHMRRLIFSSKTLILEFFGMILASGMTLWFVHLQPSYKTYCSCYFVALHTWIPTC